jgi:hypothetical protein
MMRSTVALALPLALLAGCSSEPQLPDARCRAAGASAQLGQPLTDRTADAARMNAGAVRMQVVPHHSPESKDIDPQRLNIEVDEKGIIQRLRCG